MQTGFDDDVPVFRKVEYAMSSTGNMFALTLILAVFITSMQDPE
jgi:hypothetical protein